MALQRIHTVNDFGFAKRSDSRYAFDWSFGDRRYHLWTYLKDGDMQLDAELHSNNIDPKVPAYGPRGHKKLDPLAKAWGPMREDLLAALTPTRIAEADATYAADEHRIEEKQLDERYKRAINRLNRVIDSLEQGVAKNVFCALLTLPRDDLLRLL